MPNYNSVEFSVRDRVLEFIQSEALFSLDDFVLVGYSGGADSTCLLHLLNQMGFKCVAAYLHHGQREEADDEQRRCEEFAETLNMPFLGGRAHVPEIASEFHIGLEEAGRRARYDFFERGMRQLGCTVTATGHTATDQVETILFNLARGTGMKGLRGMRSKRDSFARPLLPVSRTETEEYCREHGLNYSTDSANHDLSFSRSRIRARITPELAQINPGYSTSLLRMAEIVKEEDDFLDGMAAAALEQSEVVAVPELSFITSPHEFEIDTGKISGLPPVLFKRAIRLGVHSLGGEFDSKHVLAILEAIRDGNSGSLTSPEQAVIVTWNEQIVHFSKTEQPEPFRWPFEIGILESEELGWRLTSKITESTNLPQKRTGLKTEFSLANLKRPLYVRNFQSGDRMTPLGFNSARKVSDLLAEAKLSRQTRSRLPIVCDMIGPIWIPGICLDARTTLSEAPEEVMSLTFGPL